MLISDRLKLRHLEVFVEVARKKSVTQAALALGLNQPSVSRTIRELEEITAKPLLEKHGRGIRLSSHGQLFLDFAGRALALARDGVEAVARDGADGGPPIVIGALPTVSATLIPEAVARFRASGLRGQLGIRTGENDILLDQLRRGALDLVVGRLPAPENMLGLSFDPLFRERVVAVVARDHPLAGAVHVGPGDLDAHPVLLPSKGSIIRPFVERLFLEHGLSFPPDAIETVSDSFGRSFTRRHGAIWFISQGAVRPELDEGLFVKLPLDAETTLGPVGLCIRRDHRLSPTAERFCEVLRALAPREG